MGIARQHDIPLFPFGKKQRKDDLAAEYRARFRGSEGILFIGDPRGAAIFARLRCCLYDSKRKAGMSPGSA